MNEPIKIPASEHLLPSGRFNKGTTVEINQASDVFERATLRLAFYGSDYVYHVDAELLERAVRAARILAERDKK